MIILMRVVRQWPFVLPFELLLCYQEAEKAGEEGNVDEAVALMEEVEELQKKKAALQVTT